MLFQLLTDGYDLLGYRLARLIGVRVSYAACYSGLQAVDALLIGLALELTFRVTLGEYRRLQRQVWIRARGDERTFSGLCLHAQDFRLQRRNLRLRRADIRRREGRIEPREHVAGTHALPLGHVDRADNRGFERLHDEQGLPGDHLSLSSHDSVDRDQPQRRQASGEHARDDPYRAACRAGDRGGGDGLRWRLEFQDRRKDRIVRSVCEAKWPL